MRAIRELTNAAQAEMSGDFEVSCLYTGRPGIDDRVWDATVCRKNRESSLAGEGALCLPTHPVSLPAVKLLLSYDHFPVDGTQIEARMSVKSFRTVDGEPAEDNASGDDVAAGEGRNRERDFLGARWSNETHRPAGEAMVSRREKPARSATVAMDKCCDTAQFVRPCKVFGVEALVARITSGRSSPIGEEMAASEGSRVSQVRRQRIGKVLGRMKTVACISMIRHRGPAPVACHLTRLPRAAA